MVQNRFAEDRDIQYLFFKVCSNPDNLIAVGKKRVFFGLVWVFSFIFVTLTMLG